MKCIFCNKKTILEFLCKCKKGSFCINCRQPEEHRCEFDFSDKTELIKKMPKIKKNQITFG